MDSDSDQTTFCSYASPVYLASKSPRRQALLKQLQQPFVTISVDVDETQQAGEQSKVYVERIALAKAQVGWQQSQQQKCLPVLGADTIGELDGELLLKPVDEADVVQMLQKMSGRTHQVMTSVALVYHQYCWLKTVTTQVTFRKLTLQEIKDYWQTGEPVDKAGAYAIQGLAGRFVQSIHGSYSAVVGLPLCETDELLKMLASLHE